MGPGLQLNQAIKATALEHSNRCGVAHRSMEKDHNHFLRKLATCCGITFLEFICSTRTLRFLGMQLQHSEIELLQMFTFDLMTFVVALCRGELITKLRATQINIRENPINVLTNETKYRKII